MTITVAVIILTGVLGNMFCEIICKVTGITHPVAKGIAIGTSSHAIGTARAMQLGEVEGAMSGLSIVDFRDYHISRRTNFCRILFKKRRKNRISVFSPFVLAFVIQI